MARRLGDDGAAARWEGWFERGQVAFDRRLWRGDHYAYDDGGGPSSDSIMADQLAGQWYADATGLGDLMPPDQVAAALRTIHRLNVRAFADGRMGAVNGMRPDGTVDHSSEQSAEVWVGHGLRAGGVHDRARPRRRGLGDRARRRRDHLRARPVVPDARGVRRARATSGPRSTCGRWRSGRSRRRCGDAGARSPADVPGQAGRTRSTNRPIRAIASSSCSYAVA